MLPFDLTKSKTCIGFETDISRKHAQDALYSKRHLALNFISNHTSLSYDYHFTSYVSVPHTSLTNTSRVTHASITRHSRVTHASLTCHLRVTHMSLTRDLGRYLASDRCFTSNLTTPQTTLHFERHDTLNFI